MRFVFALLCTCTFQFSLAVLPSAGETNPVTYHVSFENLDFLSDDWISQLNVKTIDERKLQLVPGKFGQGLYLGAVPLSYDADNMSGLDLDLVTAVIFNVILQKRKGVGFDEPFIWGSGKLHPARGSVAFWTKGPLRSDMLFNQSTTAWGRKERRLVEVRLMEDGSISAYVEDARYVQHSVRSKPLWVADDWNHIVFMWDRASGVSLWVNGKEAASSMGTDAWWENQHPGLFHIPMSKATYDELYLFNRPLEPAETADLYAKNQPPAANSRPVIRDAAAVKRLKEAWGANPLTLPVLRPSPGKELSFEEITPDRIQDEGVPGWWISDGRYDNAQPYEYSAFTIIIGDEDYHAEKADVLPPRGANVNYVTFEGNLDSVKVFKGDRSGKFESLAAVNVPQTKGFFYGATAKSLGDAELRIPYTKSYGPPPGFTSDVVKLPLSGNLRIQEFGIFHVAEKSLSKERGDMTLYLNLKAPALYDKRYQPALNSLFEESDRTVAGLYSSSEIVKTQINSGESQRASLLEMQPMSRLNLLSEPMPGKTAYNTVILDMPVKSPTEGNILSVRVVDSAVPAHTWSHAEVTLRGFSGQGARLSLSLKFDPEFLAQGDRVWIQLMASDGLTILTGDKDIPATVTLRPESDLVSSVEKFSIKTLLPNILTYGRSFEYLPWQWDKRLPDINAPVNFGGQFDMAYPWEAVLRVNPGDRLGNIYKTFGTFQIRSNGSPSDPSAAPQRTFKAPANAPAWAVYFREFQKYRWNIVNWWSQHQRSDGQLSGGWDDDVLITSAGQGDMALDSNPTAFSLYNRTYDGFDKTNYFKDGYCRVSPIDRLHCGQFVQQRYKSLIYNLGDPRSAVWAMEEAWHYGKEDKTPVNYGDGRGFLPGKDVMEWYWGKRRPDKPFENGNIETITGGLRQAVNVASDTTFWRFTAALTHTDDQSPVGMNIMAGIINGGVTVGDRKKDSLFTVSVGVGWIDGGGPDLARLVEYSGNDGLKVRMFSFDGIDRPVLARLYRLDPGTYSVTLTSDANGDGVYDAVISQKQQHFTRFSKLPFTVPPLVPVLLEVKQISADPLPGDLPDLALSSHYLSLEGQTLKAVVYNIGTAPSGPFTVFVVCPKGDILARQQVNSIEGSSDFVPKKVTLFFPNLPDRPGYTVVIDPDKKVNEIYKENNSATISK